MIKNKLSRNLIAGLICAFGWIAGVQAVTPADQLAGYVAQAGAAASPERGQSFFTSRHGREWSCSSCHGASPT